MFRRRQQSEQTPPVGVADPTALVPARAEVDYTLAVQTLIQNGQAVLGDLYKPFVPTDGLVSFAHPVKGSQLGKLIKEETASLRHDVLQLRHDFDALYQRGALKDYVPAGLDPSIARARFFGPVNDIAHRNAVLDRLGTELRKPENGFNEKVFSQAVAHLDAHPKLPPEKAERLATSITGDFASSVIAGEQKKMRSYTALSEKLGLPASAENRMVTLLSRCMTDLAGNPSAPKAPSQKDIAALTIATYEIIEQIVAINRANPHKQEQTIETKNTTVNALLEKAVKVLTAPAYPEAYAHEARKVLKACARDIEKIPEQKPAQDTSSQDVVAEDVGSPIVRIPTSPSLKRGHGAADLPSDGSKVRLVSVDPADWLARHKGAGRTAAATVAAGAILVTSSQGAAAATPDGEAPTRASSVVAQGAPTGSRFAGTIIIGSETLGGNVVAQSPVIPVKPSTTTTPALTPEAKPSATPARVVSTRDTLGAVAIGTEGSDTKQPDLRPGEEVVLPIKAELPPEQKKVLDIAGQNAEVLQSSARDQADSLIRQYKDQLSVDLKADNPVSKMLYGVADTVSQKEGAYSLTARNFVAHAVVVSKLPGVLDDSSTKTTLQNLLNGFPAVDAADLKYVQQYAESITTRLLGTEQFKAGTDIYTADQLKSMARLLALSEVHNMSAGELTQQVASLKAAEEKAKPAPAPAPTPTPPIAPQPEAPGQAGATDLEKGASETAKKIADQGKDWYYRAYLTDYLARELGIPLEAASGLTGNFVVETGSRSLPTDVLQKGGGDGHYWAQWGGGRLEALRAFAQEQGLPETNPMVQAKFIVKELTSTHKKALNELKAAGNSYDKAALAVMAFYEVPGDYLNREQDPVAFQKNLARRVSESKIIAEAFTQPSTKSEKPAGPEGAEGAWHGTIVPVFKNNEVVGMKAGGEKVPDRWKGLFYLNQHDERWAEKPYQRPDQSNRTFTSSGCGPTSQAMVYSNLLGKLITPVEVGEFNVKNGYRADEGTSHGAFAAGAKHFGLQAKSINPHSLEQIKAITDAGGFVITNGTDNDPDTPGTKGGHIFVIRGVTAEGRILVLDPNSFSKTMTAFDPQNDIFDASSVAIAIYK